MKASLASPRPLLLTSDLCKQWLAKLGTSTLPAYLSASPSWGTDRHAPAHTHVRTAEQTLLGFLWRAIKARRSSCSVCSVLETGPSSMKTLLLAVLLSCLGRSTLPCPSLGTLTVTVLLPSQWLRRFRRSDGASSPTQNTKSVDVWQPWPRPSAA